MFRCIQLADRVINSGEVVAVRDQAGCPVDDFVVRQAGTHHYYQLKNHQTITWGTDGWKLRNEFIAQREACRAGGEDPALSVVVAHPDRKQSLEQNCPAELTGLVSVVLFEPVGRPSELAHRQELAAALDGLSASRRPGAELLRGLTEGFHLAWVESVPAVDGWHDVSAMTAFLQTRPAFRLRRPTPDPPHPRWPEVEEALRSVPDLWWAIDRGYFEWAAGDRDSGLYPGPCDGDEFRRFADRVLTARPATFDEFEGLL